MQVSEAAQPDSHRPCTHPTRLSSLQSSRPQSSRLQSSRGLCDDRRRAELDGPLRVAKGFCACDPCLRLETDDCLLPQLVGKAMRAKAPLAKAPLAKGAPVRVPQMLSLTK